MHVVVVDVVIEVDINTVELCVLIAHTVSQEAI